jgi:putative transposase
LGSYNDNLFIERLWRTVRYEEVYLKAYQDGREANVGIGNYFQFSNNGCPHQALEYRAPAEVFTSIPIEITLGSMLKSLTQDPMRIAGPTLNTALTLS